MHLYTDLYGVGDVQSQIRFTADYLRSHLELSADLQKPLIITEVGKLPPLSERNAFFSFIFDLAEAAASTGGPFAGKDGWSVLSYRSEKTLKCSLIAPASMDLKMIAPFCEAWSLIPLSSSQQD